MAVTTAKQAEKESEKSFGRRHHRLAVRAGNFIDKRDLTTIYVEGLPTFVQAGLRMHLTPGMGFETYNGWHTTWVFLVGSPWPSPKPHPLGPRLRSR
jgi:hypothetical protein